MSADAKSDLVTHDEGGSFGLCRVELGGTTIGAVMQWPSSDDWRVSRGEGTEDHLFDSRDEAIRWLCEAHDEQTDIAASPDVT